MLVHFFLYPCTRTQVLLRVFKSSNSDEFINTEKTKLCINLILVKTFFQQRDFHITVTASIRFSLRRTWCAFIVSSLCHCAECSIITINPIIDSKAGCEVLCIFSILIHLFPVELPGNTHPIPYTGLQNIFSFPYNKSSIDTLFRYELWHVFETTFRYVFAAHKLFLLFCVYLFIPIGFRIWMRVEH